jgi:hypothetical protein
MQTIRDIDSLIEELKPRLSEYLDKVGIDFDQYGKTHCLNPRARRQLAINECSS